MKHVKRSDCRTQARGLIMEYQHDIIESEVLPNQINQAWDAKERKEAERIKRETDASWKEYESEVFEDDLDRVDNSIAEIEAYFQILDEIDESKEFKPLYPKNISRGLRRRKNARANNRLLANAENAKRNMDKRIADDLKSHVKITKKDWEKDGNDLENLCINSKKDVKSRVAKTYALVKKAKKLQC